VAPNSNAYTIGLASDIARGRGTWRVDYEYRDYADIYGDFRDTTTGKVTDPTGRTYDLVIVKNTPDAVRTYKGLNANLTYRLGSVQAGGNYTLSWARGNIAGEDSGSGPIRASLNDFPEYRDPSWNAPVGYVMNDQRHKVRTWLSYMVPLAEDVRQRERGRRAAVRLRASVRRERLDRSAALRHEPRLRQAAVDRDVLLQRALRPPMGQRLDERSVGELVEEAAHRARRRAVLPRRRDERVQQLGRGRRRLDGADGGHRLARPRGCGRSIRSRRFPSKA
jgi:hypothetical protein